MAETYTTKMHPDDVERYLHAEMSEAERDKFDERLLGDDAAFFDVADAEDHLIDRYAAGRLSESEAARFETAAERRLSLRSRIANARALQEHIEHERPRRQAAAATEKSWLAGLFSLRSSAAGLAMSLALIAAIGLSIYFYVQAKNARDELARATGGDLQNQIAEARRDIERLRSQVETAGIESDELVRSLDAAERRNSDLENQLAKSGGAKPARQTDAPSIGSLVLDDKDGDGNKLTTTSVESGTKKLAVSIALPATATADAQFAIDLNGSPFGQRGATRAGPGEKLVITVMAPRNQLKAGINVIRVLDRSGQEVTRHTFSVDER